MDRTDPAVAPRKSSLVEWIIILAILAVGAAIAIPGLLSSRRATNERHASTSLKTISIAEADFRANDRDGNRVNDFWVADVKGLYTMTSALVRGNSGSADDPPIKLIDLDVAAADGDAAFFPAAGENMPLATFASPAATSGYWFYSLTVDHSVEGTPEMTYRQNTKGKPDMGDVHNPSRIGFAALPASSSTGKYLFWVNENNTIFRQAAPNGATSGSPIPPGRAAYPKEWLEWPTDAILKSYWSRLE